MRDPQSRVVGIDLTGSEARPTGWALLQGNFATSKLVRSTDDIVRETILARPDLVSIDSPLSLPEGRHCTGDDDPYRFRGITRACERELRKRGVGVYPCLIPSMQALTARGIRIASRLREAGLPVIESFPGAAQDIMGIPRKRVSQIQLRDGLLNFGVIGIRPNELTKHDELDAVTSAIVGAFYLADAYEPIGNDAEGYLIVPRTKEAQDDNEGCVPQSVTLNPAPLFVFVTATDEIGSMGWADTAGIKILRSRCEAEKVHEIGRMTALLTREIGDYHELFRSYGPSVRLILGPVKDGNKFSSESGADLIVNDWDSGEFTPLNEWISTISGGATICL